MKNHTWISDRNSQKLLHDFSYHLDGMVAGLVADWISHEQLATSKGCSFSDFGVVVLDIFHGDIPDKLIQHMI
jgi:hypothetical protein